MKLKQLLNKLSLKKPSIGFWLIVGGFVLAIIGFSFYFATYSALGYNQNYWVIALMIIALWSIVCLLINGLISGNRPFFMDIFYAIAVFALVVALLQFLTPCLSPIGIYFTVHNMGDVEANAIGVPRAITGIIFYVLAVIYLMAAAFLSLMKDKDTNDLAETGLVLAFLIPPAGLVYSILGLRASKEMKDRGFAMSIAGIVVSAVVMISLIVIAGVLA